MQATAAQVLRQARHAAGLTQSDLARRAGVVQPVISAYETGRREPGLATLTRLVHAAGLELSIELVEVRSLPDTPTGRQLGSKRDQILSLAAGRGASNVRVFGSVARGEDHDHSDVDLLVDLADNVGLVGLIGLERELEELLNREVDVVPARSLKPALAARVLSEAIAL